jgi:effector-binding domain-containing protein
MAHEVTRVTSTARPTAVVAEATTWAAFPALWPRLLSEVRALLGAGSGLNVMLYKDAVPNVEVGVLVESPFVPAGRVTASCLPAGEVATTVHRGPYQELDAAHTAVLDWCDAQGFEPAGVRWEIYGHHNDDPAQCVTEVHYLLAIVEPHEYTASLTVSSETLSLGELTAALGSPSSGRDRGDPVSRRTPDGAKRRHSSWILKSAGGRARPLEDQIEDLVAFAEERREALGPLAADHEARVFCGIFSGEGAQGGFTLEPGLLRRLADIGLPVVFDLY